jgi:hypothetical protein
MTYKEIYKELEKKILEDYGRECSDFTIECFLCRIWMAMDIIENLDDEKQGILQAKI